MWFELGSWSIEQHGKEGEFNCNLQRGGTTNILELADIEELTAIKADKTVGLSVVAVDMLQSKNGPLVLELSSIPGLEGI